MELVFLRLGVSFLTSGGKGFLRLVVSFFLVLCVRDFYFWGLVYLRLGVRDSYVLGLGILTFCVEGFLRLGVIFLTFGV